MALCECKPVILKKTLKYFLIAGEVSGDKHGAKLIEALMKLDTHAEFIFMGGDMMEAVGRKKAVLHISKTSFMGFVEVLKNIFNVRKNFKVVKEAILREQPEIVIFIDYPGFNLRLSSWVKKLDIATVYYITPTVWAWHASRIKIIQKNIDLVIPILPFEKAFFGRHGVEALYCGNPVLEDILKFESRHEHVVEKIAIALLPGSRKQEIAMMVPVMIELANQMYGESFKMLKADNIEGEQYEKLLIANRANNIQLVGGQYYEILCSSKAAVVTSGTATLETALLGCPQIVVYKTSGTTYAIAKRLVKIKYISLVNLILDRPRVKEFIQDECTVLRLKQGLEAILVDGQAYAIGTNEELRKELKFENASERVASLILEKFGN